MNPRDDRVDDRTKEEIPGMIPVPPTTLAQEAAAGGWQAATLPSGAPARPMAVAGTRGAVDQVADGMVHQGRKGV